MNADKNYILSVIIPIYNAEKYLQDTLESIINQSVFGDLEVILINDGSTDNSMRICNQFANLYANIKIIVQNNKGVSVARNSGLNSASGKYVTFLDADDLIDSDLYENELKLIQNCNADIAIVDFKKVHLDGRVVKYRTSYYKEWDTDNAIKDFYSGIIGNQVVEKIFLKETINNVRFLPQYKIGEDMYFMYQAILNAKKIVMDTRICGYHYMVRESSAMTDGFNEKYFDSVKLSYLMVQESENDKEISEYAKAHLIHETCKALEYTYRNQAEKKYERDVVKMRKDLKKYSFIRAKKYLVKKQFWGFALMRISPKLYLYIHKKMRIG